MYVIVDYGNGSSMVIECAGVNTAVGMLKDHVSGNDLVTADGKQVKSITVQPDPPEWLGDRAR